MTSYAKKRAPPPFPWQRERGAYGTHTPRQEHVARPGPTIRTIEGPSSTLPSPPAAHKSMKRNDVGTTRFDGETEQETTNTGVDTMTDPTLWQRFLCVLHGGHYWIKLRPMSNDPSAFCLNCLHPNYRVRR